MGSDWREFISTGPDDQWRGVDYGIEVLGTLGTTINLTLNEWAKFKFFLQASFEGSLKVQFQTLLNLFGDIGMMTRLQAVAKAAIAMGLNQT